VVDAYSSRQSALPGSRVCITPSISATFVNGQILNAVTDSAMTDWGRWLMGFEALILT
jgi:hypothetical protein